MSDERTHPRQTQWTGQHSPANVPLSAGLFGVVAGTLGGFAMTSVVPDAGVEWVFVGAIYGYLATVVFGTHATDPGRGLIWSLATGVVVWLVATAVTIQTGSASLPLDLSAELGELIDVLLLIAAPVGLAVGFRREWLTTGAEGDRPPLRRGLVVGAISGLGGGVVFGLWLGREELFETIAGVIGMQSTGAGLAVHIVVVMLVGAVFGLLFQRDLRGWGSTFVWGLAYGLFWWMLGSSTLFPAVAAGGEPLGQLAGNDPLRSFIAHVVFGATLGVVYAVVDQAWQLLFYESDPINRVAESPDIELVEAVGYGMLASLAAGLAFAVVLLQAGSLSRLAGLVGQSSALVGFGVHMIVSVIAGGTYGLLFRYESPELGSGVGWGMVYGLFWWFVGDLTLLPLLSKGTLTWNSAVVADTLPSLAGHLFFGAVIGAVFYLLERRPLAWGHLDSRVTDRELEQRRPVGTPAPALWTFVLGTSLIVVLALV
jgi:uncharacterized membrane protein YagU involved in acid resistance